MKLVTKTGAIFDHIIDFLAVLAGICVIAIMLLMCYQVFMRYFLRQGVAWVVEINEYLLFLLAFLGAAWLLKKQGHVRIDLVVNRLNPKAQTWLNIVTSFIGVIVCLIIAWYAGEVAWDHFQRGVPVVKTLRIPKAPLLAFISLCSFLLSMQFLRQAYGYFSSWRMPVTQDRES